MLLNGAGSVLDELENILNSPIQMVFQSIQNVRFWRKKDLTILDAVSFIIAIPTTVIWKTIKGTAPP